ncbi:MAG TPA: pitrilysin family protein [Burkholderiales bacterium]|nr:pitrilysin family protein [Burkholderiales bacterium]
MSITKRTLAVALLPFLVAGAAPLRPQERFSSGWTFPVTEYRLKNGLRVVLSEDDTLPVVSVVVAYGAGSIREQPGQTGLAFLLENLMFQGSENVSPLQHLSFIQKVGGELNANTTLGKTLFYETLPSNQLALALWLESDRMKSLTFAPASVESIKEDLAEAHRRRLATEPYLDSYAVFDAVLYPDFPYGHPLVGGSEELKNLTPEDVRAFYERYYVPANAVLVIVGDFPSPRARELVARYFDSIPPGTVAPTPPLPRFEQEREVVQTLKDILLPTPGFHLGFRLSPLQTGDRDAMRILDYLLFHGKTSRLYTRIMKRDLTAYYLSGGLEVRQEFPAFKIFALNINEVLADRCLKAILSEFDRLKVNLVPEAELDKAKRMFKMDYLRRLSSTLDRGLFLADAAFDSVPVSELSSELDRYMKVSAQSINSLMTRLFVPSNMVILNIRNR